MKRKHSKTLEQIYRHPTSANISERAGSRVAVVLFGEVRVFNRPHPSPSTDKGAVASIRKWLEENEVTL